MPASQLRCETYVSPEGDMTGENAIECGAIALPCADCGDSAGVKSTRSAVRNVGTQFVRAAPTSIAVPQRRRSERRNNFHTYDSEG